MKTKDPFTGKRIEVEERDKRGARRGLVSYCPVARTIRRILGIKKPDDVHVSYTGIYINTRKKIEGGVEETSHAYRVSESLHQWMYHFDAEKDPEKRRALGLPKPFTLRPMRG